MVTYFRIRLVKLEDSDSDWHMISPTDRYKYSPDTVHVPPIHAVSYHVAMDKPPAQNGDKFRSIFSDNLQPIATRGKKAHGTLLVDKHCCNGCSIKHAPLSISYYNEISGGHSEEGLCQPSTTPVVSPGAVNDDVTLYFFLKKWRPFLVIVLRSGDLFFSIVTTPTVSARSFVQCSRKFSRKKFRLSLGCHPWMVSPRGGPSPLVMPLQDRQDLGITMSNVAPHPALSMLPCTFSLHWIPSHFRLSDLTCIVRPAFYTCPTCQAVEPNHQQLNPSTLCLLQKDEKYYNGLANSNLLVVLLKANHHYPSYSHRRLQVYDRSLAFPKS